MNLTASLNNFLRNEEEQKLLMFFDHKLICENGQVLLLCDKKKTADYPTVEIHPKNIQIAIENFFYMIQKCTYHDDYISYLEQKQENSTITLRRFIDEGDRENFILSRSYPNKDTTSNLKDKSDNIESSLHLAPHFVYFESHFTNSQISFFDIGYIKLKIYRSTQEGKMRNILRPFYQTHRALMENLEEKYPDLEEISQYLLPHRFEDFAGIPWMKIYK